MSGKKNPQASFFPPSKQQKLFSELDNEQSTQNMQGNTLAASFGIYTALTAQLGDSAYVIHPDLGSIHSLMSSNAFEASEAAINYAKTIAGFTTDGEVVSNGFIPNGGQLTKPIVMLLNTVSAKPRHNQDTDAEGVGHWVTCVILPKQYITPLGVLVNNICEKIYFIDPLYTNVKLPNTFKAVLSQGVTIVAANNKTHQITAPFPNAEFIDCINVCQQAEGSLDCGWWSLYNALKIVVTGNDAFLAPFRHSQYQNQERPTRRMAYRLRALFSQLDNGEAPITKKEKAASDKKPKNEFSPQALQAAIAASLQSFHTYQARNDAVPGRRGNDYQTLVLLYHALESYFQGKKFTLKTEVDDGTNIDDLQLQIGNQVKKYQIKHATNDNDYYTPADLLHVTKTKLVNSKPVKDKKDEKNEKEKKDSKGGAPLVHFFESWYLMKYQNKSFDVALQIELALFTNYDFNERCLQGLLNPETKMFYLDFLQGKDIVNKVDLNAAQKKFRTDLFLLIKNLKVLEDLSDNKKNELIIEFFSNFKFLLKQPYIDELEKKIRELLKQEGFAEESIYYSLYYKYNLWLRTRLEGKRTLTITEETTRDLLIELKTKCKFLQRLIGRSQTYLDSTVQTTIQEQHIERLSENLQLNAAWTKSVIFVQGAKGIGKSAFLKHFIQEKKLQDKVLFLRTEADFQLEENAKTKTTLADILAYFTGIELIVIDSAEAWLNNVSQNKRNIIAALLAQKTVRLIFTITDTNVNAFMEQYSIKAMDCARVSIELLSEQVVSNVLLKYTSKETLQSIQKNTAVFNVCRIPFWLNNFVINRAEFVGNALGLLNEADFIENMVELTIKGKDKTNAKERKVIWLNICVQSGGISNRPVRLPGQTAALKALEEERIIVKNQEGYILQHDLYYDIGMRVWFSKQLQVAQIGNSENNFFSNIEPYIQTAGIQFRLIKNIGALFSQNINSNFIEIYFCAAIFALHDEACKTLLTRLPKSVFSKRIYFLNSQYEDFYLVALHANNSTMIQLLKQSKKILYFAKLEEENRKKEQARLRSQKQEESDSSDDQYTINSDSENSENEANATHFESLSISDEDPHQDWYKFPRKYCFANFRPDYIDAFLYDDEEEDVVEYDESPSYYNCFQYFIVSDKYQSYAALTTLLQLFPALLEVRNNFTESALHYAVQNGSLALVELLLELGLSTYACDQLDETPLHNVVYRGNLAIARVLLEDGADPNHYNCRKVTPFHIALAKRDREMIKLFFEFDVDVTKNCYDHYSLVEFLADVEDDIENDDFILFLMELFNYGYCDDDCLNHIDELSSQEKIEIIKAYYSLEDGLFNDWVKNKYNNKLDLMNKIIIFFNNRQFAWDLEELLKNTELSEDHSHILYYDEATEFEYHLENGDYFAAIDCLTEIDEEDIEAVFDKMDEYEDSLEEEMMTHLIDVKQVFPLLAHYAFTSDNKIVKAKILKEYLFDSTVPQLLEIALEEKDDDLFDEIKNAIQWDDDIVKGLEDHFSGSNERINELLEEQRVKLEN